jgi:transcriptional regulator with XRE-family HTH domain
MVPTNEFVVRFAANLVRARRVAGLSQEEVSIRAAIHRTELGMLERAIRVPRLDTFVKLCGALEVTPDKLLDGIEWTPAGIPSPGRFVGNAPLRPTSPRPRDDEEAESPACPQS